MLKIDNNLLFGTDGSGNQKKAWIGNRLYKVDSKLRESTKEVSASALGKAFGLNVVQYHREKIHTHNSEHWACWSESYCKNGVECITLSDIINYYDINIPMNTSAKDMFIMCINAIHSFTHINKDSIISWLIHMIVFDFIIANNDRHLSNIEFIYSRMVLYFEIA